MMGPKISPPPANEKFSLAPPAQVSLGQKIASETLTTQGLPWGRGGGGGTAGLRERENDTSSSTGRSGRQNAATRCNMRREERVTVQGPVKKQPDGMSHRGHSPPTPPTPSDPPPRGSNAPPFVPMRVWPSPSAQGRAQGAVPPAASAAAALPPPPEVRLTGGGGTGRAVRRAQRRRPRQT